MCKGSTDMRWQFGGNFEPVRMLCEIDYKECPFAILNYIWSEVVTDVVDCLTNDILVWRVLALMVALIVLIHTVYYKLRWVDETTKNRENLNRVGFKVQDLELKVNILTYKMQYGTWPLPHHIRQSNMRNELHNVRLTLSNSEDRNAWIKHLLLSPRKNKDCNLYNRNLTRPVKYMTKLMDLETKFVSSKYQSNLPSIESGDKAVETTSDISTRKWKRCKKCFDITLSKQRQISKSENLGFRRRNSLKIISLKKDPQKLNNNFHSNEIQLTAKDSKIAELENKKLSEAKKPDENLDISVNHSESTNTYSDRDLCEENESERDSNEQFEESDINYDAKKKSEDYMEKVKDLEMESLTKREYNLQLYKDDTNSTNEIQLSAKSTNESFYSWTECSSADNTPRNEDLNILPSSLSINCLTETFTKPTPTDKSTDSIFEDSTHRNSLISTQETLHQVREKLVSLHNVLVAYEAKKEENRVEIDSIFKDCVLYKDERSKKPSKVSFNMDIKKNFISEDETLSSSEYEQCESIIKNSSTSLSVQSYSNIFSINREVVLHNHNFNRFDFTDSGNEAQKIQEDLERNSNVSINTITKIQFESRDNLAELQYDLATKRYDINSNIDRIITSCNQNYITENRGVENYLPMDTGDDEISESSSQVDFLNDENSDKQSTTALLQEALQFKDALLSQLEFEKEKINNQTNLKEAECDFRKNTRTKTDSHFQTKFLDIISEEQSASSSTEKTSKTFVMLKKSDQSHSSNLQCTVENPKYLLASTSSEYFSLSNISENDKFQSESNIASDKEISTMADVNECKNKFQIEVYSSKNKRSINSEISPDDLTKRLKYTTLREENCNNEEKIGEERTQGKDQEKNTMENSFKNYGPETEFQKFKDQNSNIFSPIVDSSSDESLIQFIKEFSSDKVKAVKIFKESKLNLNSTKPEEKLLNSNEFQEIESTVALQRRPGSFSITENTSQEKLAKIFDSNSCSYFEFANSEMEVSTHCPKQRFISVNNDSDLEVIELKEKAEEIDLIKVKPEMDKKINKSDISCKKTEIKNNFYENDSTHSFRMKIPVINKSASESLKEDNIFEKKSDDSVTKVSARNECKIFLQEEMFGKVDNEDQKRIGDSQETIFEDAIESSITEDKICRNKFEISKQKPKFLEEEVMLIDLSDNHSSGQNSETEKPQSYLEISISDTKIPKTENLNILHSAFAEKITEDLCLIPTKIQSLDEPETTFNFSNATESYVDARSQDFLILSEINLLENTKFDSPNVMKISEGNRFSYCPGAPILQRLPWNENKSPSIISSSSMKSRQNKEIIENSRNTLHERSGSREKSRESSKSREESFRESLNQVKSYLNLTSDKQNSSNELQKRSNSFGMPQLNEALVFSSNHSSRDILNSPIEADQQSTLNSRTSIKSGESQKSSRSCIPILKTRLENIRKSEHKFRPRSPTRGPLTISPRTDNGDLMDNRDFKAKKESTVKNNECNGKSFGDNSHTAINLLKDQCTPEPNEKTIIYVKVLSEHEQSKTKVMDPKKFLEYVKGRELKVLNSISNDQSQGYPIESKPKIMNVVSSVIEEDELSRNLQNKFPFQVEQKEREVSVKPSVMDNSTSVSDFPEVCEVAMKDKGKFQIFQVPEELTKEEYINLLDILNKDPNLEQLRKMHNLCSKLGLDFQE